MKQGADFKGGVTSFHRVEDDIRRLVGDSDASLITTMIDYYGLPDDFPKIQKLKGTSSRERALELEMALEEYLNFGSRFLAYFMIHEFEALLFSQPAILSDVMNAPSSSFKLQEIRDRFSTPEEINDCPQTRPSEVVPGIWTGCSATIYDQRRVMDYESNPKESSCEF